MIGALRCSVCGRRLGLVQDKDGTSRGRTYCPDRPCILYPSLTTSRPADPTVSAWVLAVHTTTPVQSKALSLAMGRNPGWASRLANDQMKRWQFFI